MESRDIKACLGIVLIVAALVAVLVILIYIFYGTVRVG